MLFTRIKRYLEFNLSKFIFKTNNEMKEEVSSLSREVKFAISPLDQKINKEVNNRTNNSVNVCAPAHGC